MLSVLLSSAAALIALVMGLALIDQWRERRRTYQLVWAIGILMFGAASACEALGAASGWTPTLFKTWYLAGAVLNVGWLGLGTAFLLAKTRFGYAYAAITALAGVFTVLTQAKNNYPDIGAVPFVYLIFALVLAVAVAGDSYFEDDRWPRIAAIGVGIITVVATGLVVMAALPSGAMELDGHGIPELKVLPGTLRLLTPLMNVTGGFSLIVGALFSAYVFMPKRRVLGYSLDPGQSGDQMLFNLVIAPVAIVVNFAASLPGATVALFRGQLHSRVPATILIAVGALLISGTDLGVKDGATTIFELSKLVGVALIFLGFLVSIEAFREVRIPFTTLRLMRARHEEGPEATLGAAVNRPD
jgi:hypothetical protein